MASERRSSTNGHTSDDIHATNPTLSLAVRSAGRKFAVSFSDIPYPIQTSTFRLPDLRVQSAHRIGT